MLLTELLLGSAHELELLKHDKLLVLPQPSLAVTHTWPFTPVAVITLVP